MNLSPVLLFVACLASAKAGEPAAPPSPVRAALRDELKGHYHSTVSPDAAVPSPRSAPADAPIVRMAPVIVIGDARFRDLEAALNVQLTAIRAGESWSESPTTLFRGKGLLPKVEIKVTPHDRDDGFDFLRLGFSW